MFEPSTYADRRRVLRESVGSGLILFLGNDPSPMNYPDNPYHFKQDSSFLYYFGLDQAGQAIEIAVQDDLHAKILQNRQVVGPGRVRHKNAPAGPRHLDQRRNLAGIVHADFDDSKIGVLRHARQCQRDAPMIVE